MADCTYSRCIQQRRNIKRDLQRWTKTMVYIVGLERIAEELMGRRKWKLYQQQDSMQRNNYLVDVVQQSQHHLQQHQHSGSSSTTGVGVPITMKQQSSIVDHNSPTMTNNTTSANNNNSTTTELSPSSTEMKVEDDQQLDDVQEDNHDGHIRATSEDRDAGITASGEEDGDLKAGEDLQQRPSSVLNRLTPEPRDWSPQSKCHFCVDGKLHDDNCSLGQDHHHHQLTTSHGGLSPQGHNQSDSDSTGESLSDGESSPPSLLNATPSTGGHITTSTASANRRHRQRHHHHLHQQRHLHHMQHRRPRSNSDVTTLSNTNNHHQNHHNLNHLPPATAAKLLQLAVHHLPPPLNMATLDSMTLAAMAAMGSGGNGAIGPPGSDNGGTGNNQVAVAAATAAAAAAAAGFPYYPGTPALPPGATLQQQHNLFQIANAMRSAAAAAAAAGGESDKGSESSCSGGLRGGEQPLDLSAKPTTNSSSTEKLTNNIRLAALDSKHIFNSDFRAKPRMPTVAGRRTYTEEELQAALRDIQSGKLGTRRAAVIYGIPRSTLRNKVYKLALERERETHLNSSAAAPGSAVALKLDDEDVIMDDDKELSGAEEEKEVEKVLQAPLLNLVDFLRCSESNTPDTLKSLLIGRTKESSAEYGAPSEQSQSPINPYLHSFLLGSGGLIPGKFLEGESMNPGVLPELIKRMFEDQMAKAHQLQQQHNNGDNDTRSSSMVRPSPSNSVIMRTATRSESDMEAEESASNVILKIPSYKPTGSTSNNSSKNGDMAMYHRSSLDSSGSMVSPPVTSDSDSPPILTSGKNAGLHHTLKDVKDVIAASISKKFQQSEQHEQTRPLLRHSMSHTDSHILDFKRTGGFTPPLGGISVIKTQDLTRPYSNPQAQHTPSNKPSSHHHHQQQQAQHSSSNSNSSNSGNSNAAGGKGTRPKRGKYRNYDRDSLVEAVRAVQRGEMSVHRAGSYYGVPHSTLEYKVKERHLMRPRKRDPKPNPVDEKIASLKQNDQQQQLRLGQDKLPSSKAVVAPGMKQPPQGKFPPNSPNGIKLPLFDPAAAAMAAGTPIGFNPAPFPFWTPTFHSHIPSLDFSQSQSFPNNSAEHHQHQQQLLASQVMQKLHDDAARRSVSNSSSVIGNHPPSTNNTSSPSMPALPKSHRHIAESLLDGCTSNGSFLDGIIRSSLESGVPQNDKILLEERNSIAPENLSNKALLEQLMCRNNRLKSSMSETSSGDEVDTGSYRKEVPSPSGLNDNSMEHDPETIELSNDSQDGRPHRNMEEDEEMDQREEVIIKPPVQGRIYVKHDLMDRGPSDGLLRFRDLSHLESPVGVLDRNGTMGEDCPVRDEPLDGTID